MLSPKSRKGVRKITKKSAQIFRFFFSFRLWPPYLIDIKIVSMWPQHALKHAEMQSETRGVQSFGAKSRASGMKTPAQHFKNQIGSPDCLLLNALEIVCRT